MVTSGFLGPLRNYIQQKASNKQQYIHLLNSNLLINTLTDIFGMEGKKKMTGCVGSSVELGWFHNSIGREKLEWYKEEMKLAEWSVESGRFQVLHGDYSSRLSRMEGQSNSVGIKIRNLTTEDGGTYHVKVKVVSINSVEVRNRSVELVIIGSKSGQMTQPN